MTTFMDEYRAGLVDAEEIHDYIAYWHRAPVPWALSPELHVYLGLTWEEFKRWVDTGELPATPSE